MADRTPNEIWYIIFKEYKKQHEEEMRRVRKEINDMRHIVFAGSKKKAGKKCARALCDESINFDGIHCGWCGWYYCKEHINKHNI